jgi:O-acetyl-ADP-ribose deacetylase (regulator of RNase III)
MKIIYKTGNLLDAPEKIILHGVNASGVFRSGVAKQIREKWPWAYEEYMKAYKEGRLRLGNVILCGDGAKVIGHAVTQEEYGYDGKQYVDYEAIKRAVAIIRISLTTLDVAMPKIGAGLGGGDWNTISDIVEDESRDAFQPVVYTLEQGVVR